MAGDIDRTFSRAEIDARARVARVALERNALALGVPQRRLPLLQPVAELWRYLTARGRDQREA
jgi:hypothetical protein